MGLFRAVFLGPMEERIRQLIRAERKRLKMSQITLAQKSGVAQGTISKIEIDPSYDASFTAVIKIVSLGLGLPLSSVVAPTEVLPAPSASGDDRSSPQPTVIDQASDEALSTLTPQELRNAFVTIGRAFSTYLDQHESEGERGSRRRHPPAARDEQAVDGGRPRTRRKRPAAKRLKSGK